MFAAEYAFNLTRSGKNPQYYLQACPHRKVCAGVMIFNWTVEKQNNGSGFARAVFVFNKVTILHKSLPSGPYYTFEGQMNTGKALYGPRLSFFLSNGAVSRMK